MYGPNIFREERYYRNNRLTRALSPQTYGYRPSSRLMETLYVPQIGTKFESVQSNLTEFINQLQEQLRRISPTFAFKYSSDPPLLQALSYITQSIDIFIDEKQKFSKSSDETRQFSLSDEMQEKNYAKVKEDLDKAKETSKNLSRYEQLLKKKEEKLEQEKSQVRQMKKKLIEAEEEVKKIQAKVESQEKAVLEYSKVEQEKIRDDKEDIEKKMIGLRDMKERFEKKFEDATKHLKYEKDSLSQLENILNETKTNLLNEQKRISLAKVEVEKEKWDLEQRERRADENNSIIQIKIEKLQKDLEQLEDEKQILYQNKEALEYEKQEIMNLRESSKEENKFSYVRNFESQLMKDDSEKEEELGQACEELQRQVENINKELDAREQAVEEKELSLVRTERELQLKLDNFRKIESSLTESKLHCEDLKTSTIAELESQSQTLENLIREVQLKKNELEVVIFKLNKEVDFVQKYKNKIDSLYETKETYNDYSGSTNSDSIKQIALELEEKVQIVNHKIEELIKEELRLEDERTQNAENAEFLKRAHKELEITRAKYEKSNIEETEKIKAQMLKFQNAFQKINEREEEVNRLLKELEKKEQDLMMNED